MERDLAINTPTPVQPSPDMRKKQTKTQFNEKNESFNQSFDGSVELAAFTPSSPTKNAPTPVMVSNTSNKALYNVVAK